MRKLRTALFGALAVALTVLPACDWLQASGSGSRVSPFLSDLEFTRSTVLCEQPFGISFRYDDPQRDLGRLLVSLEHVASSRSRDLSVAWFDGGGLDLQTAGRAVYTFEFSCDDPGGSWTVEVQVEDDRGHLSNTLRGTVSLNSAVR